MTKVLNWAQRQRLEKEDRATGLAEHLGSTVEAEAELLFGERLGVTSLNPMQLHRLTGHLWQQVHALDRRAVVQLNQLTPEEQHQHIVDLW